MIRNGRTQGGDDEEGATGQGTVHDDSWADVYIHGFWKWVTSAIFDIQIVNLDAGSYLWQMSAKAL